MSDKKYKCHNTHILELLIIFGKLTFNLKHGKRIALFTRYNKKHPTTN